MVATDKARLVLTTTANPDEARRLGRALVEERLAACATLIPQAESVYHWEGKIESATETILLLKTEVAELEPLESRLLALHSYQTPEFLVIPLEAGSQDYLAWIHANVMHK